VKTLSDADRGAPKIARKASRTLRRLLALFAFVLGAIAGGAASAQDAQTPPLKGQVVVSRISNIRIHTYVSPQDGWLVNTQIVEGPEKLVIFDAQLLNPYAAEVAAYAASLGKPVDRIIVSHGHPDHWAGLEVLAERFPGVALLALPAVAESIRTRGDAILGNLRPAFGDRVARKITIPAGTLAPGKQTIAGVRFEFREFLDAESEVQLLALMPDQKVMLAFDLVFAPQVHAFITSAAPA
jgi:hypothetical protein